MFSLYPIVSRLKRQKFHTEVQSRHLSQQYRCWGYFLEKSDSKKENIIVFIRSTQSKGTSKGELELILHHNIRHLAQCPQIPRYYVVDYLYYLYLSASIIRPVFIHIQNLDCCRYCICNLSQQNYCLVEGVGLNCLKTLESHFCWPKKFV